MVWLGLLVLFAVTLASAYIRLRAFNISLNLMISVVMIGLLLTFLMGLVHSTALLRIIAGAGLFWSVFMFALTFTDYPLASQAPTAGLHGARLSREG